MSAVIAVIAPMTSRTLESLPQPAAIADEELFFHQRHALYVLDFQQKAKPPPTFSPTGARFRLTISYSTSSQHAECTRQHAPPSQQSLAFGEEPVAPAKPIVTARAAINIKYFM
jgi:hypothetical protein